MSDDEIPPKVDVYRVLKPTMIHAPHGARLPTWEAFRPTDEDKSRAPARVSVWDSRRTTVQQAKEMRIAAASADPQRRISTSDLHAFELLVEHVLITAQKFNNQRMRVVLDPDGISETICSMSGADGHSGIEGLDKPNGAPKSVWKDMLLALAECCRPASDPAKG
ncbi:MULTISPECIES: hypothetical protein [Sorangium]|uniref:hypothetical protein n=1 Tax=Sorangium TaxID=39643 RepID=UPI003D9C1FEC